MAPPRVMPPHAFLSPPTRAVPGNAASSLRVPPLRAALGELPAPLSPIPVFPPQGCPG